ncbi:MAG: membrane protein insertase YidC [Bacteroidota bacterium]
MNKNTIIGLIIIFSLFIGYSIITAPSKEEIQRKRHTQDSLLALQIKSDSAAKISKIKKDTLSTENNAVAVQNDTVSKVQINKDKYSLFSGAAEGENKFFILENENIKIALSSKGGKVYSVQLKNYKTYDSIPLILFKNDSSRFGLNFFLNNRNISTNELIYKPFWYADNLKGKDSITVAGNDSIKFGMRLYAAKNDSILDDSRYIEYQYTLRGNDFQLGLKINLVGMQDIVASNTGNIALDWFVKLRQQERNLKNERVSSTVYFKFLDEEVDYLSESKDQEQSLKTKVKWLSFKQQFFTSILVADNSFANADIKTITEPDHDRYLKSMQANIGLQFGSSQNESQSMWFYFGPNKYNILKKFNLNLERQIPLGWSFFIIAWINRFAVIPVFDFLNSFNLNYGIIILILTILLKIFLFPIAYKTYISSAKMRVLKPEIEEINKKFPKKEDSMKKQQANMALYKKAGVNPMAGCIPMLLQMPILIAMFRFFPSSIELRQQSFLWAHDLSSYDSIINLPWNVPFYGDHVSLFTLLMTITTIFYTKINNDMMSTGNQMPGMKVMMYIMPIMFLGMFNNFASGLSYYYFLANIFTFFQMWIMRKFVDEDAIHRKIQENKIKPVKKSSFQARLEEMAKKRGVNPNTLKKR